MFSKKKLFSLIVLITLLLSLTGCLNGKQFSVVDSNLVNYEHGVSSTVKEIKLKFNNPVSKADVTLTEDGKKVEGVEVSTVAKKVVIKKLDLKPIANYNLSIVVTSKGGEQLSNKYEFITEPSYPTIKNPNQTMMQTFYWELGTQEYAANHPKEANLWNLLANRADHLANKGITSVWVPPANKAKNQGDKGYGAYDLWDLGEFDQAGGVRTKYGTKKQLESAIDSLHEENIKVYYDAVLNQRIAPGKKNLEKTKLKTGKEIRSYTSFPNMKGRNKYYSQADQWKWNWKQFDGVDYDENTGMITPQNFVGKSWDATYGKDYLMGADVDYENSQVVDEMKEWGQWIINDIGFDGFRIDAAKHIDSNFLDEWITTIQKNTKKDVFFVGEAWIENSMGLNFYLSDVKNKNLTVFDFPLRMAFERLSHGVLNMSALSKVGLVNKAGSKNRAVTFVDNHDTGRDVPEYNTPITSRKMQAYTYILTRKAGLPMIFWKDYYISGYQEELDRLLEARKYYAYGVEKEVQNHGKVYSYVRKGLPNKDNTGLVMMISTGSSGKVATRKIKTDKPNTTFYDYTRNIKGAITTDDKGYAEFKVRKDEESGWSVWVPSN